MDIAAMSVAMNQQQVRTDASLAVMNHLKDVVENQNEQLISMLQQSVPASHPTLGQHIDVEA
ncbi:MAG TPA: YjfB family protein [Bacillota bacterium]|nr:YjfB family protein [Bacillota bacterium]